MSDGAQYSQSTFYAKMFIQNVQTKRLVKVSSLFSPVELWWRDSNKKRENCTKAVTLEDSHFIWLICSHVGYAYLIIHPSSWCE